MIKKSTLAAAFIATLWAATEPFCIALDSVEHASQLVDQFKLNPAKSELDTFIRRNPTNLKALAERSRVNVCLKHLKQALSDANKAIAVDSKKSNGYAAKAFVEYAQNEFPKALDDAKLAVTLEPTEARNQTMLSASYLAMGDTNEALVAAEKAIKLQPELWIGYEMRGKIWLNRKNYVDAIDDLSKAISLNKSWPGPFAWRALCFQKLQQYVKAMSDVDESLRLDPSFVSAHEVLGHIEFDEGKFKSSIGEWTRLINTEPCAAYYAERARCSISLAQVMSLQKEPSTSESSRQSFRKALKDSNRAIALDPKVASYYIERALALKFLGLPSEALADCNKALERDPQYPLGYEQRADINFRLGKYLDAVTDCTRILDLEPRATARLRSAYTLRAKAFDKLGKREESEQDMRRARSMSENAQ